MEITENKPLSVLILKSGEKIYAPDSFEKMVAWKNKKDRETRIFRDMAFDNWDVDKVIRADTFDFFSYYVIDSYPEWIRDNFHDAMEAMDPKKRKSLTYENVKQWIDKKISDRKYYEQMNNHPTIPYSRLQILKREFKIKFHFSRFRIAILETLDSP